MFNEKRARQMMAMKDRRHIDDIDRGMEALGNAERAHKAYGPAHLGKRISKTTRQLNGRRKTADLKATVNMVRDTAEIAGRIIVGQSEPRQLRRVG